MSEMRLTLPFEAGHVEDVDLSLISTNLHGVVAYLFSDLSKIHWYLTARETDTNTGENATSNELSSTVGGDLHSGTDEPSDTGKCDEDISTILMGNWPRHDSSYNRAYYEG